MSLTDYRFPDDEAIFEAVNGLGWAWLDQLWMLASTRTFGITCAVGIGLLVVRRLKRKALRPVLQVGLTLLVTDQLGSQVLKPFFHRLHPCFALPAASVHQLAEISVASGSMPSLHAANSFAFAVALALCLKGSARYTLPVAGLIALSRVGVGVHWPSDVLAGAFYGALVAAAAHGLFQLAWPARKPTSSSPPVLSGPLR